MSNPRFEELEDDDPAEMDPPAFGDASSSLLPSHDRPQPAAGGMPKSADAAFKPQMITQLDLEQFKSWSCVYPVYFDASRSYKEGRRVPLKYAVKNPMAQQLAEATTFLNVQSIFEVISAREMKLLIATFSPRRRIRRIGLTLAGYEFHYKLKRAGDRSKRNEHYISQCRPICSLILLRLKHH